MKILENSIFNLNRDQLVNRSQPRVSFGNPQKQPKANSIRREPSDFSKVVSGFEKTVRKQAEDLKMLQRQANAQRLNFRGTDFNTLRQRVEAPEVTVQSKPMTRDIQIKEDLVFKVADSNQHDVLSSKLSKHTEAVKVKIEGGRSYSAEELAATINEAIDNKRETRRPDLQALVVNGELRIQSGEGGDTSEVTARGNAEFARIFGQAEITVNGTGGTKATLLSDNVLADGRKVSSGGNRVALRYWSSDGEMIDKKIVTERIDQESLSGQEILDMYNKAFEEQIDGALSARFDEEGRVLFESAKGGDDNGFRLVRMGGNFTTGTNEVNYATRGQGGEQAAMNLSARNMQAQGPSKQDFLSLQKEVAFQLKTSRGTTDVIRLEPENGELSRKALESSVQSAGLQRRGIDFSINDAGQLNFELKGNARNLEVIAFGDEDMQKRLEENLGLKTIKEPAADDNGENFLAGLMERMREAVGSNFPGMGKQEVLSAKDRVQSMLLNQPGLGLASQISGLDIFKSRGLL